MKKQSAIRSPMFYTGDKYKIIGEIKKHFPHTINKFIEPFVGGGSVLLNVEADKFCENDIDTNIINLHKFISSFSDVSEIEKLLFTEIENYNLSCSYIQNPVPLELREQFKKTYFAKYNKPYFSKMKDDYNDGLKKNNTILYLLLIYGFNRMLRFNREGKYNVPVGNVDYNQNVHDALSNYISIVNKKNIIWSNKDFVSFLNSINYEENDFVYLDPPYLITASEYNKLWDREDDDKMMNILDDFTRRNIKFAMSNVVNYKGQENTKLLKWAEKYNIYPITSNYINYHDNSIKTFREVLITNYEAD